MLNPSNISILTGRLVRDPELKYIPGSGTPTCKFVLAIDRILSKAKKQELKEQGKPTADFLHIVIFGKVAESCANYLQKGSKAQVVSRVQTRTYDDDEGKRVYITEFVADAVNFLSSPPKKKDDNLNGFQPVDDDDIPF